MTPQPTSTIRCSGCGYLADPDDPYPFRCPRAGSDDTDHVLARVLGPEVTEFPRDGEDNPFLRYRTLLHSYHAALAHGVGDAAYRSVVTSLDAAVAAVDGRGFRTTPFFRSQELSASLRFSAGGGVWVKDETGNVSGSHKGRHLMGVLIHLAMMEECGLTDRASRPELAIASCGNAALAAATLARAAHWRLTVFVPPDADAGVVRRLRELAAQVVVCPREPGVAGDPTYLRLREALHGGALPFTTQGTENGLVIEGGETLGYELVNDLASGPVSGPGNLDHLVVQVGGGALASSCVQAVREARELGALGRLPRFHAVQPAAVHPLERAYRRVRALLPDRPESGELPYSRALPNPGVLPDPAVLPDPGVLRDPGAPPDADALRAAMAEAAAHRSAFMRAWEAPAKSVATGILDDETYDWRAIVEGMLTTGGRPLVVGEQLLGEANRLAVATTGVPVDPTGSAGLAGLIELRRRGEVGDDERVAVLFTGVRR